MQYPDSNPQCAAGIIVADPLLGPLTQNGGFTPTHLPQGGSPAINAVTCVVAADQRGLWRPQGGRCDIGPVEVSCPLVKPLTLPTGRIGQPYAVTFTSTGGTGPVTYSLAGPLPAGMTFDPTGVLSGTPSQSGGFAVTITAADAACSASRPYNLAVADSAAVNPAALEIRFTIAGLLEPNVGGIAAPSWMNQSGAPVTLTGTLSSFIGPPGATYTLYDGVGGYGTVPHGATARCIDCYALNPHVQIRPEHHMDLSAVEALNAGGPKAWTLHLGSSFSDVPRNSGFYRFVETLFHRDVTAGCGGTLYCPLAPTTREAMAVFVLAAREGAGYSPPPCSPPNTFDDVPETSPFCRWIEELAQRGAVAGCGGGNYCPGGAVAREQMPVFVLRTLDPSLDPPACTPPNLFADVPESSPFCRWIEELARRGVVTGCGGGNYCPADPVTREQVAVFLTGTFGLTAYGP